MKKLLLVSAVLTVVGGSGFAMTGAASEVKAAGVVKEADKVEVMVVATDSKDAKVAETTMTDKTSAVTLDTSTPETIYESIKGYVEKIMQKTGDEGERASLFEQLGTAIRNRYNNLASVRNEYGRNALHIAAQRDDVPVTAILLVAGIPANSRDSQDNTAHDIASFYENTAVMDFFVEPTSGSEGHKKLNLDFAA